MGIPTVSDSGSTPLISVKRSSSVISREEMLNVLPAMVKVPVVIFMEREIAKFVTGVNTSTELGGSTIPDELFGWQEIHFDLKITC